MRRRRSSSAARSSAAVSMNSCLNIGCMMCLLSRGKGPGGPRGRFQAMTVTVDGRRGGTIRTDT
jgi:hypothetical protein